MGERRRCGLSLVLAWVGFLGAFYIASALAGSSEGPSLRMSWQENILTVSGPHLPGGKVEIWYLEAFCRSGSTDRDWRKTVIPHETVKLEADPRGKHLRLRSIVEPGVVVVHEIRASDDEVDFQLTVSNPTSETVDVQWVQPCIRVGTFTGLGQADYMRRCFLYTDRGRVMLDQTRRTEEARYRGGQVYVPAGIDLDDVNPRPLSPDVPVIGLIGCVSADGKLLLATAWDHTQELFQGVIVCIHNDFRIGGMKPGETKKLHGKLYLVPNDPAALLARYQRDFPNRHPRTGKGD